MCHQYINDVMRGNYLYVYTYVRILAGYKNIMLSILLVIYIIYTIQEVSKGKKGRVKQSRPLREGELAGGEAIPARARALEIEPRPL